MGDPTTDAIQALIRKGAHVEATAKTAAELGSELGRFCMGMLGDRAEATDVLTELLVAFHDAMPALGAEPVRTRLYGLALELCRRRLATRNGVAPGPVGTPPPSTEYAGATRDSLARLDATERELLLLRYAGRLDYEQAAKLLELDEAEAHRRVGRGLLGLRQARRQAADENEDGA